MYPVVGTVLQSRLYRTEADVDSLAGLGAHVRLCIGIYRVPPPLAMQKKRELKPDRESICLYVMVIWSYERQSGEPIG